MVPGLSSSHQAGSSRILGKIDQEAQVKKMSLDDWRQHVRQNHVPFRRDCRVCVEEMGQDVPHRRRKHRGAGDAVYVLAVDVAGPFVKGWDYGMAKEAKYALVATIPVPVGSRLADPKTSPCSETEAADDGLHPEGCQRDGGAGDHDGDLPLPSDPLQPLPELRERDGPDPQHEGDAVDASGHGRDQAVMDRLNEEWKRQRDIATNPIDIQNITVVEPLSSRATRDVLEALHRVYARYRSLGIPIYRLHSDRAKELISAPVRQWAAQKGLWQTSP